MLPKPTPILSDSVLEYMLSFLVHFTLLNGLSLFRMFSLKGKVAVITGAAAGIGYQVARAYAEAGGDVALFYNTNASAVSKSASLAKEFSVRCKAYQVDGPPLRNLSNRA
jgi:hypothetical protein